MSNTAARSAYDIQQLSNIVLSMDKYMLIIIYITGIIGSILNIITFLQKQLRTNSCSVYFLATSIIDFCIMNVFLLTQIIATFNEQLSNTMFSTRMWCKIGNYITFLLPCLSSSYLTLASADRFCISSLNPTLRKWSQFKISRIIVIIIFIIWTLFGLHIPFSYDYIRNISTNTYICQVQTNSATIFIIIDGFFFALFNGAIIPFLLCIFGLMIYHNVKQSRRRVASQQHNNNNNNSHINRRNSHMIIMVLVQVILTVIFHTPYTVIYLLSYYEKLPTNQISLYFVILFTFIARWFYYMNYCKTFYINTLTSGLFRENLRKQLIQYIHCYRGYIVPFIVNTNTR